MDDYEHYGVLGTEPRSLQEQQGCLVISPDPWLWFYCWESGILMHFLYEILITFMICKYILHFLPYLSGFIIVSFIAQKHFNLIKLLI